MEELKREQEARDKRTAERESRRNDRRSLGTGMVVFHSYQFPLCLLRLFHVLRIYNNDYHMIVWQRDPTASYLTL